MAGPRFVRRQAPDYRGANGRASICPARSSAGAPHKVYCANSSPRLRNPCSRRSAIIQEQSRCRTIRRAMADPRVETPGGPILVPWHSGDDRAVSMPVRRKRRYSWCDHRIAPVAARALVFRAEWLVRRSSPALCCQPTRLVNSHRAPPGSGVARTLMAAWQPAVTHRQCQPATRTLLQS